MATDLNTNIQSEQDMRAIEMKYEGYNMKEISVTLDVPHITVRSWFYAGGRLHQAYIDYAKEETELRRKTAHDIFKAHVPDAVRTLVSVMSKSKLDIARVQAAKEIINRQMGEPLKIIATDEGRVNEYLEAINQFRDAKTISGDDAQGEDRSSLPSSG